MCLWLQSLSAVILEAKKIKSVTVSIVSPSICHEVMGLDAVTDSLSLGSKITVDSDYAMKLEDACFLERKLGQT